MALTKIKTGGITDNAVTDAKVADAITVTGAQTGITQVGTLTALTGGTGDLNWDSGTLFVDSSTDAIGIGTTSPNSLFPLHIHRGNAGTDPSWETTEARNLALFETDNNEAAVTIFAPASAVNLYYAFADPSSRVAGYLKYNHNTDTLALGAAADDRVSITSSNATFASVVLGANGSASAPSFSWSSDTNTGMYRTQADHIGFTTAGTKRVEIASDGGLYAYADVIASGRVKGDRLSVMEGSSTIGHLIREETITGAGSSNDLCLFAETGLDLHFMTGGSVTKVLTLDTSNNVTFANQITGSISGSGRILNETASATNPTLNPRNDESSTGIGGVGSSVYIISNGTTNSTYSGTDATFAGKVTVNSTQGLEVNSVTGGGAPRFWLYDYKNDNESANIQFHKSKGDSIGSHGLVADGTDIGRIAFYASDGNSWEASAEMRAEIDGTPADGDVPGRLSFSTTPDGSSATVERVRITSSGEFYVGSANEGVSINGLTSNYGTITGINRALSSYKRLDLKGGKANVRHRLQEVEPNHEFHADQSGGWGFRFTNFNGSDGNAYFCHGDTHGSHIDAPSATASTYLLELFGGGSQRFKVWGDGQVDVNGSQVHAGSDISLKKNISTLSGSLAKINAMRGVKFKWKAERDDRHKEHIDPVTKELVSQSPEYGRYHLGLIAQEVEEILPEVVNTGDDGIKSISDGNQLSAVIIEAIKEITTRLEALENA